MRITFVNARFYPFLGGAEEYCLSLAREAVKAGHFVRVITTDVSPDSRVLPATEILDGIEITRLHAWNQELNLGFYPRLLPTLWNVQTDVIHVTNGLGFFWRDLCLVALRFKQLFNRHKIKFITTPHGLFLSTVNTHKGFKRLIGVVGKTVMLPYFWLVWRNLFDLFLQDNTEQYKWMTQTYKVPKTRIGYVPVAIPGENLPANFPLKDSSVVGITFVARWEYYKGILDLIQLAAALKKRTLTKVFKVMIMGRPGPATKDMQALIKKLQVEDVVELIPSPTDEVRDQILITKSHINILPSEFEATGIALLWSMAFGNAIITTLQNEAWPALIEPGVNGFVFNYGDVQKLTELVAELINNPEKLEKMQHMGFDRRYNFTWEKSYQLYAEYLK